MHYAETKDTINNVLHYNKIMKHRMMTFLKEHPKCADSLKFYFDATAINIENTLLQMISMTGVSKSTIHRYYQQQTRRESLEPQRHLCGAKEKVFPDWCLGAIQSIIMCKYFFNLKIQISL